MFFKKIFLFEFVITIVSFFPTFFPLAHGQLSRDRIPPDLSVLLNASILEWEAPEVIKRTCTYYLSGYDEDNRPIWVFEWGIWPTSEILARGPQWVDIYNKYVIQMFNRIFESINAVGTVDNPVTEAAIIIDMDKYLLKNSLGSLTAIRVITEQLRLIAQLAKFSNHIFLVNTNYFAQSIVNILRPVLGSALERVDVYGTNSKAWIPRVLKALPRDQLPPKYGGLKEFKPVKFYG